MPDLSVMTIAAGRADHLHNVVLGLNAQTCPIDELVIGVMQEDLYDLPETAFPVRQVRVTGAGMPLAAARNRVAEEAAHDKLIFLDVDCIPSPTLVEDYDRLLSTGTGLFMGEVAYLPGGATEDGLDFDRFERLGVRHSDRRGPPEGATEPCDDYRCFWSLNFAMGRADWDRSGGFDEAYTGYGGEDTDFGRGLAEKNIPISWARGAKVYHQYHPHCMPPVHHVASVIRNAEVFASKWGHRTMEHWLYAFKRLGLIEDTPEGLRQVREPDAQVMALCEQQSDQPYASTRRVLDLLDDVDPKMPWRERHANLERAQASLLIPAAE